MKRRVVKHGSATLTISLPIRWVKKYGIKPGDELEINEEKGNLLIATSRDVNQTHTALLNLDKFGSISMHALGSLYRSGCDVIRINFKEKNKVAEIDDFLLQLPGFEIMQQDEISCTLKEVSTPTHTENMEDIIKRTFLVLISITKELEEQFALPALDKNVLQNLCKRDSTVNKFCNFCRRILNKKGISRIKDAPMVYYILESLENLGDSYKHFCTYLAEQTTQVTHPKILTAIKETNKLIETFFYLYFKFSIDNARKFQETARANLANIASLHALKNPTDIIILDSFARITTQLIQMVGPLLAMRLPDECTVEE